ncbi:hypothetical protein DPMN_052534 [Dreissena polymorpha]|uniref:Uncharacterized protein n=1 Tax=Dreissena polymorpha TaxID=45954 RepID=A0A9D4CLX7_DREPO|nr:hypothetical protein DPMN_052534 [Dreissena polymorpha]
MEFVQDAHAYVDTSARLGVHSNTNAHASHNCRCMVWTLDEEYSQQTIQNKVNPIRLSNTVELMENNEKE